MTLAELKPGQDAYITAVGGAELSLKKHILDMGLTPGTEVTLVKTAPMGDPLQLTVRGYELTLRKADAARIEVSNPHDAHEKRRAAPAPDIPHPHTGEMGVYHVRTGEAPIPDGKALRFALAGNQNCGKTTLFNQLTGSNQHVGNFPGVTVEAGAVVRNCVLFKGTVVRRNAQLSYIISDKNVEVLPDRTLMGHATYPIVLAKGSQV